jgi:hypothetical protein
MPFVKKFALLALMAAAGIASAHAEADVGAPIPVEIEEPEPMLISDPVADAPITELPAVSPVVPVVVEEPVATVSAGRRPRRPR